MVAKGYSHLPFLSLIVLSSVVAVLFQGSRGLYETTEGRYAECAREMLLRGDFLEPTLDFQPHWTKPPLTYWAIATGIALLGRNEWGARAYLIPTFCLLVATVYLIGDRLWGKEVAFHCGLVYATSLFPVVSANIVSADTMLALWEALAVLGFWISVRSKKKRGFALMWFSLGMGFLTKGPPSLIPLLAILPVYALVKRQEQDTPSLISAVGVLLFSTAGLTWYGYEGLRHPGLIPYWIRHEVVGHVFTRESARNPQWYKAILIYGPTLILGALPWLGVLVLKSKVLLWSHTNGLIARHRGRKIEWSFIGLSFVLPLIAFSLSQSKLPFYILPLFLPVSLAIGRGLYLLVKDQRIKLSTLVWVVCITVITMVAAKGIAAHTPFPKDMRRLALAITSETSATDRPQIIVLGDDPLYGLEFYLDRLLVRVSWTEGGETSALPFNRLQEAIGVGRDQGESIFVLVHNKGLVRFLRKLSKVLGEECLERPIQVIANGSLEDRPCRLKKIDEHWSMIRIRPGSTASPEKTAK